MNKQSNYNFDEPIIRKGKGSRKWDDVNTVFGSQDVLPLWIADMDFAVAPAITLKLSERCQHPIFAYNANNSAFGTAVCDWVKKRHNWDVQPEWIVQTPGVVPGIILTILALSKPGDGIIIQPPVYPPFFSAIADNQRIISENPLLVHDGYYEIDYVGLEQQLAQPQNKILLLCNPHNPVGRVWRRAELVAINELCRQYNVVVLSDEIHSDLVYSGHQHTVFANLGVGSAADSVTFMAASKTFNIAGLNTSYIIVPSKQRRKLIETEIMRLHVGRNNLFGVLATIAAYQNGADWLESLLIYLEKNVYLISGFLAERLPKVQMHKPEGTFLAWLNFGAYFDDATALETFLIHEAKVGLNAGQAFGSQGVGFARLNFATRPEILLAALTRIEQALKRY